MNRLLLSTVYAVLMLGAFAETHAGLININESIDINGFLGNAFFPISPRSIADGDTVDMTVTFSDDKALQFTYAGNEGFYPWLFAGDNDSGFTISNIAIQFLGFQGTGGAADSYGIATESNGNAHLGPRLVGFLSPGQSVLFTGYHVTYTVDSIAVSPHTYNDLWLVVEGDWSVVSAVSAVPEPSSIALLGMGITGLGGYRWRRKRKLAA